MKKFPNFPTCHCHPQSLDSASTPKAFLKREQEIGILQYESEEIVWFKPSSDFPEFANTRSRGYLP